MRTIDIDHTQEDLYNVALLQNSADTHQRLADALTTKGEHSKALAAKRDALIRKHAADYYPGAVESTPEKRLKESLDYGEWRVVASF